MAAPTQGTRLGGSPAHQKLILANLATSLFEKGKITTTEAKAKKIVTDLKQGKDFKQLAMANSADIKALDGGDLGWRQLKEIPTIFAKQVPNMQIDEVLGPIQSASGYHIIKLYGKRFGKKQDYLENIRSLIIRNILVV